VNDAQFADRCGRGIDPRPRLHIPASRPVWCMCCGASVLVLYSNGHAPAGRTSNAETQLSIIRTP
jgi:hypothetical protein